jgi:uncharacterized protein YegL
VADIRAHLLPAYVLADESSSMKSHMDQLNEGLASLHEALLAEPMAAAKVRLSVLGFSSDTVLYMELADLRRAAAMPRLAARDNTSYRAAFADLSERIPNDVTRLKRDGFAVHRPAVFFLSDGQPNHGEGWRSVHRRLTDRRQLREAPNVLAFGIGGQVDPETILAVATRPNFAFVSTPGVDVGRTVSGFCTALTKSLVMSGRALGTGAGDVEFERPEGFRMAIDVV